MILVLGFSDFYKKMCDQLQNIHFQILTETFYIKLLSPENIALLMLLDHTCSTCGFLGNPDTDIQMLIRRNILERRHDAPYISAFFDKGDIVFADIRKLKRNCWCKRY